MVPIENVPKTFVRAVVERKLFEYGILVIKFDHANCDVYVINLDVYVMNLSTIGKTFI